MEINEILAKSCDECKSKYLSNHTKMVINYGLYLGNRLFNEHQKNILENEKEIFLKDLALSLAIHDIGKCTDAFQKSLKKIKFSSDGSEEANKNIDYNHNIYSWAYAVSRLNLYSNNDRPITSGILYHHVVFLNDNNSSSANILSKLTDEEMNRFDNFYLSMVSYINEIHHLNLNDKFSINYNLSDCSSRTLTEETLFSDIDNISAASIKETSKRALIRACIVLADRTVSSEKYDCEKILNNDINYFDNLYKSITECKYFGKDIDIYKCGYNNDRLKQQINVIDKIMSSNCNHSIISASAGFGKTLMGLIWFLSDNKKLTWVLPRNVIADGTYRSVIKELQQIGIEKEVKIALFRSGEVIKSNCNMTEEDINTCDILITNIDSVLNRNIKNNMANQLVNVYSSNMIFDEYHEFLGQEPLFPAFIRLMQTRAFYTNSKSILLSATPMKLDFCGLNERDNLIHYYNDTEIYNGKMNVNIKVLHLDSLEELNILEKDSFVITNTVPQSQEIYRIYNKDSILIHSRFNENDRRIIENAIYENHGKNSKVNDRKAIIGTNIIGTGLDISAKNIYDFVLSPESTIQRCCGRGGRYGEEEYNNEINYYVCILNEPNNGVKRLINQTYSKELHSKWIELLSNLDGKSVTKEELYKMYYTFYENNKKETNELYLNFFINGSKILPNIKLKRALKKNKNEDDDTKYLSNALSFRGETNNMFISALDEENNEWCDPVTIDMGMFLYSDENSYRMKRKEAILMSDKFQYPSKAMLERAFNIKGNDFSIEKCCKFANSSNSPLPLFTFKYNNKIGLYKIDE